MNIDLSKFEQSNLKLLIEGLLEATSGSVGKNKLVYQRKVLNAAIETYKEIRNYKKEITEKNESLQLEINSLKNSIEESKNLLNILSRIDFELDKFGALKNDPDLNSKLNGLRSSRFQKISSFLKRINTSTLADNSKKKESSNTTVKSNNIVTKISLLITILILPTTIGIYIYSLNQLIIYAGIFIFIANMVLLAISWLSKTTQKINLNINYNNFTSDEYKKFVEQLNQKEDELFVNAAWIDALKSERERINKIIYNRLNGYTVEQINEQISEKQKQIEENNSKLNSLYDNEFTSEDYLKYRRELDIIDIEMQDNTNVAEDVNIKLLGDQTINYPDILKTFINKLTVKV